MTTLIQDIRYGVRVLLKNRVLTFVSIVALTLGIGANTAIFTVVNAVMLGELPYSEAEQLVLVWEKREGREQNVINLGNFTDWKQQNSVFSDMAVFIDTRSSIVGDGPPEEVPAQAVTTNLFPLLGLNAMRGRTFLPDDGKPGGPRVVVIGYSFWQRRFGGDPNIIGRKITLNMQPTEIVGVLYPNAGWHIAKNSRTGKPPELWGPWQISEELLQRRGRFANAVARLKPGISIAQAQTEMDVIAARTREQYPDFNTGWGVNVVPLRLQLTGELRKPLWILLGAVGFVLLIACANVANLLLARAASRKKEIAIRAGLGAGRLRIVRQLLTESVLLSVIGAVFGLLLAWWGTRALLAIAPPSLASLQTVQLDWRVLAFTLGVTFLTAIGFGLVPALEGARIDLNDSLKEGGKNIGGSSSSHRFRNVFVVAQIALALVLLIGAGLLVKSLNRLQSVEPGFNPDRLLTMRINLPLQKYNSNEKILSFYRRLLDQVQTLPGVESVGAIDSFPFTTPHSGTSVDIEGEAKRPPGQRLTTGVCVTDDNFFSTMQIPLKRGRLFTRQEAAELRHVVVVNEAFVRTNLQGQEPIGKRVTIYMKDDNVPSEIIGVVGDSKHKGLDVQVEPMSYWPHPELNSSAMTLVVRASGDAASLTPAVRSVISSLDPDQPVSDIKTMETLLSASISRSRFSTMLLSVFSVVALLMAIVGIYGVMSYTVSQRTHEIGVRMALGAQKRDVMALVVRRGILLSAIGVVVGTAAAVGLTRLMTSLLFEVTPTDTSIFAIVAVGSFLIAVLACAMPARRATKVDPLKALRYE